MNERRLYLIAAILGFTAAAVALGAVTVHWLDGRPLDMVPLGGGTLALAVAVGCFAKWRSRHLT